MAAAVSAFLSPKKDIMHSSTLTEQAWHADHHEAGKSALSRALFDPLFGGLKHGFVHWV